MKNKQLKVILLCIVSLAIVLGACGAASPPAAPMAPDMPAAEAAPPPPAAPGGGGGPAASTPPPPPAMDFPEPESFFEMDILTHEESGRMMVYNVAMQLQTSEFMSGVRTIRRSVPELGGRFERDTIYGHDKRQENPRDRRAYFSFLIPTANLAEFILLVENSYNIWWMDLTAQDETATYRWTDTTLQDLREQESTLAALLEQTEDPDEIFGLQSQLADLRNLIAGMAVSQEQLMESVVYSTVIIELFEAFTPDQVAPLTFGEQLGETVTLSTGRWGSMVQGALVFLLMVIVPLLVVGALTLMVIRVINKLRRSKRMEKYLSGESFKNEGSDE